MRMTEHSPSCEFPQGTPHAPGLVLDTNAALDWLVFASPAIHPLAAALWRRQWRWTATPCMLLELRHMLGHRSLAHWGTDPDAAWAVVQALCQVCDEPPPQHMAPRCSDPDDQVFVDHALACGAAWLVSHDKALLRLARRLRMAGVEVLTPAEWARRAHLRAGRISVPAA